MPRKQFIQDLEKASLSGTYSCLHGIKRGGDDESICFAFTHSSQPLSTLNFQASVSDVSEYPHSHCYLIYSTSASVPSSVADILEVVQAAVAGASIFDLLSTINDALEKLFSTEDHENEKYGHTEADSYVAEDSTTPDSEAEVNWDDDDEFFEDQQFFGSGDKFTGQKSDPRPDLRAAKAAGFKVGYLGDLNGSLIISISCRISKLGISEEAMQAWGVHSTQYLVLLLRFPTGYHHTTEILKLPNASPYVQMYVGLCASYKPDIAEAVQAFERMSSISFSEPESLPEVHSLRKLLPFFLEIPLRSLLNERFITILKLRHRHSLSWSGAESLFNDSQGLIADSQDVQKGSSDYHRCKDEWSATVPHLVQDDHFSMVDDLESLSFPLVAMQFTLRHFVKCTEFCLVCHCKINASFEALKPYVCSKALCLYQYMSLGMGPSLEWEISRQPLVIDLLVSFAYASAASGIMSDFPVGLRMMVPPVHKKTQFRTATLRVSKMQLTIENRKEKPFLSQGDWILVDLSNNKNNKDNIDPNYQHYRVNSIDKWPIIDISNQSMSTEGTKNDTKQVQFALYDTNFDEIRDSVDKRTIVTALLNLLPDIMTMKRWLDSGPSGSRLLSSWDEVPRATLDLLRWIVASNRSCIMQDCDIPGQKRTTPNQNLVKGMNGQLQFRFAQGSPDKEEKFVSAVSESVSKSKSKYPTIFAWHGSPLYNWHSIIREGLHYKKVSNGRAHGDGVYMAQDFNTSLGYVRQIPSSKWPNSILNINSALSLNEVVNRKDDFVCCKHTVYVVDRLHWIQTRYLFVDCTPKATNVVYGPPEVEMPGTYSTEAGEFYVQDPQHVARGTSGKPIQIPLTIFSRSRRTLAQQGAEQKKNTKPRTHKRKKSCKGKSKKRKTSSFCGFSRNDDASDDSGDGDDSDDDDDDDVSVATLAEDIAALFSDAGCEDVGAEEVSKEKAKKTTIKKTKNAETTKFEPGTLTESSITILEPPAYATSSATKSLQQRLLQALKAQEQTAPDELGWYIDPQLINNPYQWIIELHSFELTHPLGKDLQKAGIQSIILEMRFPPDFPMSPPFVRVIRPRLLEFNHGGGGHVTMGGALCMELLTASGWLPTFSIENVLLSIRFALCSMDPRPARLAPGQSSSGGKDYSVQEAVDAYTRACRMHGWEVPKNFAKLAW